mgnify:CR=1 FL=1
MPNLTRRKLLQGSTALATAALSTRVVSAAPAAEAVTPALIEAAEAWARSAGYTEMGSDALLDNLVSHRAHAKRRPVVAAPSRSWISSCCPSWATAASGVGSMIAARSAQ